MITFYYASGSPYAWRVWLALEHKSLTYEMQSMSFSAGDLKTAEYRRINPRAKVPAIVDNEFSLYESAAILEYLEEQYPDKGQALFPGSTQNRACIRRLVNEAQQYLDIANRALLESVLFTKQEDWDESRIARARDALAAELQTFERMLVGECFADRMSAADFTIYPMVALALRMDIRKPDIDIASLIGPKMSAWMKRFESLPFFTKTYPPHWKTQ